ncbi:MAG: 1-deoxy-D-xylulose-5-phosphate reductoisomerase, partial [Candidatus Faecousia sp.]|nr:1-deoxy-D-xylulose-5-phosphate reductoisomerase [Candidatus Faecousia sp.]
PELAVMATEAAAKELSAEIRDLPIRVEWGETGLLEAASLPAADCVITAVVGMVGLKPTLAAIRAGKRIGLANKETLVCAGELVMAETEKYHAEIIPVDSEHSAIFQCLMGCGDKKEVKRLILTCSGGPFFGRSREELNTVTPADALKHPNWKMGAKITVDCATLMNKGLEVIEAMRLYRMPLEQVDVVIHRQSVVHSMVEFTDGAVMAQLGTPDMRLPIQLALTYPQRIPSPVEPLDLLSCGPLTFTKPDLENFPCLALAYECAKKGGTACPAMNGANEEAVAMFLRNEIGFYDIYRLVSQAVETVPFLKNPTLEEILEADRQARAAVNTIKRGNL